jgi:hypothetical protein
VTEMPPVEPPTYPPRGYGPPEPPDTPDFAAPAPGWWLASDGRWYPPTAQPGYGYGFSPVLPQRTSGYAIASLVLGITWWGWIGSVLAVIFGHIGLAQIRERGQGGRGMAIAGLVLGYVGLAMLALFVVLAFASDDWTTS